MTLSAWIHKLETRLNEFRSDGLHFFKNLALEIIVFVRIGGIKIPLKLAVAHFIS